MSKANPTSATEDPPPLVNGESAASDKKNSAEKYGPEDSREVAVTSNGADAVKNGTEGLADEDRNILEADDTNGSDSGCANIVGAVDVKLVDTHHESNVEAVDVKMVDTQNEANVEAEDAKMAETHHEANIEAEHMKMIDTQHEANIDEDVKMVGTLHEVNIEAEDVKMVGTQDVKMVHTQHEANSEAEEDACQDKEGKNGDNQHGMAIEGEDIKMVEAKADARNSEAQDRKEDTCQMKNHTNIEEKDMKMMDVCQKEDKEGKNGDNQHAVATEGEDIKMVEAKADARDSEAQDRKEDACQMKNHTNIEEKDMKMVDKEDVCQKEDKEGKNGDNQHAMATEGEDIKMVEAKADARDSEAQDRKEDACQVKNHTNIEEKGMKMVDKEDVCQKEDKEGKNGDNQHAMATEGEDIKMVEAKADARDSEAQDRKEDMCQMKNHTNIEEKGMKMVDKEDVCQKEDKEGKNGDNQHAMATEGEDTKMVEAKADARDSEAQDRKEDACQMKNHTNIEEKGMKMVDKEDVRQKEDKEGENEDCLYAKVAEADEMKIVEAKADVRNAEVQGNGKKEEMEDKVREKKNNTNIEDDDVKTVDKEVAYEKEGEGNNEGSHDAKVAGDEIKMVVGKTDVGNAEVEENGKKEEKAEKTEEEKNNANIETKESIVLDKDNACWKEGKKVKNEDVQDAKETDGEDMEIVEGKNDARIAKVKENRKKGEMEDNAKEKENDASIEADNLTLVDKENACQNKDKEGKIDDSQDAKAAEDGEDIEMVEAKSDAGNAVVTKNGKKEEKEDQNEEKENDISNQADEVKIVDKEDAFQKEDREKKNEDSHSAKAAEGEEITVVEAKSAAVHAEVKENGKNEEDQNKTEEKQNDNKEKSICVDKQDENKMKAVEVDKQEMDNREQVGVEKQDGSKEDEKGGVHKHEMSYGEESVKESQEVMKGEENDNVGKQEVDDREQNIKGNKEGLEEEEIVGSSKHKVAKDEQNGAAEKQEGEKQDGNVAAEKKEEEKHDARLTAEEKDKTQDGRAVAEKKVEEEVNKNIAFEKNAEIVIEMGVSKEDEEMETNGKTTADKQEGKQDNQIAGICKQEGQKKGTKRSNADMEVTENGSASKKEKDGEVALEEVGESDADKSMEESKYEAPKRKKARIVREDDRKKDKKKNGSKSREAKDLLNTPSPYSLDRPVRARKTVERLVEVIEKEPSGSLFVEKGRGTPLKNIPGIAKRISKKTSADLKFLHQLLFGRFGRAADFQDHILEFSGFVWHESDEKHRAKAKEKLDKCFKDTLFDLCDLLAIPVSRANSTKEDIVTKLLDFIAEPHANNDSTLSDDQGSNSRKRKREGGSAAKNHEGTLKRFRKKLDDEHTSRKSQHKYHELESDEGGAEEGPKEDEHMKSDSKENKDDSEEADSEQEDSYDSRKVKASKKSMEGKGSTAKRKAITGSVPKTAPVATLSKCSSRVSSSKGSKDKQSAEDSNSRKSKPITPKCVTNSLKEANERRSSGKGFTSKGKSAEAEKALPSKDELQNTIVGILKKVDINKKTFSDILELLDEHYKMDLSSRKEAIKSMIYDELIKLAAADED